jgi:hypothetical protein
MELEGEGEIEDEVENEEEVEDRGPECGQSMST